MDIALAFVIFPAVFSTGCDIRSMQSAQVILLVVWLPFLDPVVCVNNTVTNLIEVANLLCAQARFMGYGVKA